MADWTAVEVAFGLILVFYLLSVLASSLNEAIAAVLSWRAKFLERWLLNVIENPEELSEFYKHPLIKPLTQQPKWWRVSETKDRKPSYIAPETFTAAVLSAGASAASATRSLDELVEELPAGDLKEVVLRLRNEVGDDLDELRKRVERWYDNTMERVSGWYKRRVQIALALIGLAFAIALNADTINIARTLWENATVRSAVIAEADRIAQSDEPAADLGEVAEQVQQIKALDIPLGWKLEKDDPRDLPHGAWPWATKVVGILLTALAVMLGAPFWFDLLSKVARLRTSGAPPPATDAVRTGEGEQRREGVETVRASNSEQGSLAGATATGAVRSGEGEQRRQVADEAASPGSEQAPPGA